MALTCCCAGREACIEGVEMFGAGNVPTGGSVGMATGGMKGEGDG